MWAWSELATRSVGRVASARAGLRSAAEYESYGCVSKLESKVRSRSRKYITGTADDWRARIARVQYSMRHACSTMILGHANVPKTCTTNSGSATQAAVLHSASGGGTVLRCVPPSQPVGGSWQLPQSASSTTRRPHHMRSRTDCGRPSRSKPGVFSGKHGRTAPLEGRHEAAQI